jgi:hypothetical protein
VQEESAPAKLQRERGPPSEEDAAPRRDGAGGTSRRHCTLDGHWKPWRVAAIAMPMGDEWVRAACS